MCAYMCYHMCVGVWLSREVDETALALAERCGEFLLDGFLEELTRASDESLLAVYRPIRDEILGALVDLRLKQAQNKARFNALLLFVCRN